MNIPAFGVSVQYEHITNEQHLIDFCRSVAGHPIVAIDTEFMSEHTYRPDLCLLQVDTGQSRAIIDPHAVDDVKPFWQLLTDGNCETIVHSGREEFLFFLRSMGRRPHRLFDIQIAAGMVGMEYPAALQTLIWKLLGKRLPKAETRTDWRRRPLTERQLEYALHDVTDLHALRDLLLEKLEKLDRIEWFRQEMDAWQNGVEESETRSRWRRVSGISGLSRRSLEIVRHLWNWREEQARQRDRPARRILRDDLLVELARRKSADLKRIRAVHGLQRRDLQQHLPQMAKCIETALAMPEDECPSVKRREMPQQLVVLGQFLAIVLRGICHRVKLAPSLVASVQDIRDLVAFRLGLSPDTEPPLLARGWRAEVVGRVVEDVLDGKLSIRIKDPLSHDPLVFEPVE